MSKFQSQALYTVPRENGGTNPMGDAFFSALDQFMQTKNLRRFYLAAGVGSVLFAAWYLFNRRRGADMIPAPPPLPPCPLESVLVHRDHGHLVEAPPPDEKVKISCHPRGYFTPSIATAPLQLETFLRVATIPYEVNFACDDLQSDLPFMTLGKRVANDFRECMEILGEKFDVDLEKEASPSRKTASHLVDVMLENQFSWAILIWRYVFDEGKSISKIQPLSSLGDEVVGEVAEQVKETTRYHPIGRLSKDGFVETIFQGLQDMSAALGKHKYFLGENPGAVDCHAFAILCQIMWNMPGSPFENQLKRYSNLVNYVKRMKDNYWPDWNQLVQKPEEYDSMEAEYITVPSKRDRSQPVSRRASIDKVRRKSKSSTKVKNNARSSSRPAKKAEARGDLEKVDVEKVDEIQSGGNTTEIPSETPPKTRQPEQRSRSMKERSPPLEPEQRSMKERSPPLEPETITVIVKNETTQKESSEENSSQNENCGGDNTSNSPQGILKPGGVSSTPPQAQPSPSPTHLVNAVTVGKQRSGLVNSSGANTNLPAPDQHPTSEPSLSIVTPAKSINQSQQPSTAQMQSSSPPQQQDSTFHVHKPSVKFADTASVESAVAVGAQQQQNLQRMQVPSSQIPIRRMNIPPQTGAGIGEVASRKGFARAPFQTPTMSVASNIPMQLGKSGEFGGETRVHQLQQQHQMTHAFNQQQHQQQQQQQFLALPQQNIVNNNVPPQPQQQFYSNSMSPQNFQAFSPQNYRSAPPPPVYRQMQGPSMYPPGPMPTPIRFASPMSGAPPAYVAEQLQKAQQAQAFFQGYGFQGGLLPSNYMVPDMNPASMLQRWC